MRGAEGLHWWDKELQDALVIKHNKMTRVALEAHHLSKRDRKRRKLSFSIESYYPLPIHINVKSAFEVPFDRRARLFRS